MPSVHLTENDFVGRKFGRLTILSYSHSRSMNSGYSRAYWDCLCDCGNKVKARSDHLVRGNTTSCGCYRNEQLSKAVSGPKVPIGDAPRNKIYKNYKWSAEKRGLSFELSREQFFDLMSKDCFYCGEPPRRAYKMKSSYGEAIYNGIDRIDSSIGYVIGNVVPCCTTCNQAKMEMSIEDFISWVQRIHLHLEESGILGGYIAIQKSS